MKLLTTEAETCMIDNETQLPSPNCCYDQKFHPKNETWNHHGTALVRSWKFQGNDLEPLRTNVDYSEDVMIILTDF